jgi:hypothetical protein
VCRNERRRASRVDAHGWALRRAEQERGCCRCTLDPVQCCCTLRDPDHLVLADLVR